jgi:thioesterase domain-containing protein/acyl carrier protein
VAAQIGDHPDVARCVAQVRHVDGAGQRLVAYLSARENRSLSLASLHDYAKQRLPEYMVPTHFVVLDTFPLTPSGKVDTKALPEPQFNRGVLRSHYIAPGTPQELALARIWSRLLGITDIGIRDDFFELGGDSLIAVEMFASIRREFGCDLPLGALARGPNIETLSGMLRNDARDNQWKCLVTIQPDGGRTPLFCVHGGAGNVASFPRLARQLPKDQPFYGLQWNGLDGSRGLGSIERMARHYLREIRTIQPRGPYLFAGQCIGGLIAREMSRRLFAAGERVELVVMFDTPNISSPLFRSGRAVSFWRETLHLRGDRRARYEYFLRHTFGLKVQPRFRQDHSGRRMIAAALSYSVPEVPVRTVAFGTGFTDGTDLGLPGTWSDHAMGWSPWFGPLFDFVPVKGDHNQVLYSPEVTTRVTFELQTAHERIHAARPEAVV